MGNLRTANKRHKRAIAALRAPKVFSKDEVAPAGTVTEADAV